MRNSLLDDALGQLSTDPIMAGLIKRHKLEIKYHKPKLFESLTEAVVSQQLSVKAADTIFARFLKLFGGKFPEPRQIIDIDPQLIRNAGISRPKINYIRGIAKAIIDREVDFEALAKKADEEVMAELTKLKGIGKWTAEMILIFSLFREDVFSLGDLGLRTAVSRLYDVARDDYAAIEKISVQWKPYRSIASRLLWKSLDNQ